MSALLRLVFEEQRKTGALDLEAVEMAMRAAMHRAGASALSQLLRGDPPGLDEREVPCPCGHKARYREMRGRRVLTAVGEVELLRTWYLCAHCHNGQCPCRCRSGHRENGFLARCPDHERRRIPLLVRG